MKSAYDINDFIKACESTKNVFLWDKALEGAAAFNFKTKESILRFIRNGGLESPVHDRCKPWEKNPNPSDEILVDSYNFHSNKLYGYIAFFLITIQRNGS
ncbi:MAG: hypothetical protein PHD01_06075 [Geobacteraceae bacterium]|nr:hypothetical protein [Geobacteraceae bacterium]